MTDLNAAIRDELGDDVLIARDGGEFVAAENYLVMTRTLRAVLDRLEEVEEAGYIGIAERLRNEIAQELGVQTDD